MRAKAAGWPAADPDRSAGAGVERGEYEKLAAAEERMWWFRGLHAALVEALAGAALAPADAILDAGCGTGGLLKHLASALPRARIVGLDLDAVAAAMARAKSGCPVCAGSVDRLPIADGVLDAVLSADVLCHRGVDAAAGLAEMRRCLRPGGLLVLNLPAYAWLYSAHDAAVDNVRRFGRGELKRLLAHAGFAAVRAWYWNSFLFPLMVLRRKLWPGGGSEVGLLPAPVECVFGAIMALEGRLRRAGIALPFGGSILAVAVKPS
jgi:SAM-dependent methyltransferase